MRILSGIICRWCGLRRIYSSGAYALVLRLSTTNKHDEAIVISCGKLATILLVREAPPFEDKDRKYKPGGHSIRSIGTYLINADNVVHRHMSLFLREL